MRMYRVKIRTTLRDALFDFKNEEDAMDFMVTAAEHVSEDNTKGAQDVELVFDVIEKEEESEFVKFLEPSNDE